MSRKKVCNFLIFILLTVPQFLLAQIDIDQAAFNYDSTQVYWEIYYTIPRAKLTYTAEASGQFAAVAVLRLHIIKDEKTLKDLSWKIQDLLQDTAQVHRTLKIVDRIYTLVPPGNYKLDLKVTDSNNPAYIDSISLTTNIPGFSSDKLCLSDIELAGYIERNSQDKNSPFYKNTLMVIPNPNRVFGEHLSILHFYVEIYNVLKNVPGNSFQIKYALLDGSGQARQQKVFNRTKKVDAPVEVGSIALAGLPMGSYFLHFALTDTAGVELASKDTRFFVYSKEEAAAQLAAVDENALVEQSGFGGMTETDLDQDFEYASYVTTPKERELYKSIKDIETQRRFLFYFWQRYDKDPTTPANEFHKDYIERIQDANQRFGAYKMKGWQTDRGRVFLIYGEPSYINRYPSVGGARPYEVWEYNNIQGGVSFIFADVTGFKDYSLLHSTALGEVRDPNYTRRIQQGY